MKANKIVIVFVMFSVLLAQVVFAAELDDLFKVILGGQVGAGNEYTFRPGDKITEREDYSIYYSGYEGDGLNKTLLFTVLYDDGPVIVKYPNPNIIQIKDIRMKVKALDNTRLKVEQIARTIGGN